MTYSQYDTKIMPTTDMTDVPTTVMPTDPTGVMSASTPAAADTNLPPIMDYTMPTVSYGTMDYTTYPYPLVPPSQQPLARDMMNNLFGGVIAGFAKKFDLDVNLLRLLFVLSCLVLPGVQCIFYFIAWIIMPKSYL